MNKYLNNTIKKGFTLIEVMIVIGIIGILAVIAIPQYTSYIARSQVNEGISIMGGAKAVILEYKATHGIYPDDTALQSIYPIASNTSNNTKYIKTLTVPAGGGQSNPYPKFTVRATFKDSGSISSLIAGKYIELSSKGEGNNWTCTAFYTIPKDALPETCRENNS